MLPRTDFEVSIFCSIQLMYRKSRPTTRSYPRDLQFDDKVAAIFVDGESVDEPPANWKFNAGDPFFFVEPQPGSESEPAGQLQMATNRRWPVAFELGCGNRLRTPPARRPETLGA
jgi:hypothetical protein